MTLYSSKLEGYIPVGKSFRANHRAPIFTIEGYAYSKNTEYPYIHLFGDKPLQELHIFLTPKLQLTALWKIDGVIINEYKIKHAKLTSRSVCIYSNTRSDSKKTANYSLKLISTLEHDYGFWEGMIFAFNQIKKWSPSTVRVPQKHYK